MKFNAAILLVIFIAGSPLAFGQRVLAGQPPGPRTPPAPIASECPTDSTGGFPSATSSSDDFVELERTSCFGSCAVYSVRISSDGKVAWHGQRSVQSIGNDTATIDPAAARTLIEKFPANGFGNLCGKYTVGVSDGATVISTVHIAGQEKRVSDYFDSAPAWLRSLESEVDVVADTHRWIHGDPRNETFARVRVPQAGPNFLGLITPGLDADAIGPKPGRTALMQASRKGDLAGIQKQLSENADPNAQDSSGWTALMYATAANDAAAMKVLLDAGANANIRSYMGQTALMAVVAAYSAPLEKLRLLTGARADVNAQDNNGHTALMFAIYGSLIYDADTDRGFLQRAELVSLLREAGARTDIHDVEGHTVFDYLDIESKNYWRQKSESDKLRVILQNPTPGAYPPVRVKGHITLPSGSKSWATSIELQRVDLGMSTVAAPIAIDGSFQFSMMRPGPYGVILKPAPSFPLAPRSVLVPNSDVSNLEIAIPSVNEAVVRVTTEDDVPAPNFGLVFVALPDSGASPAPQITIPADLAATIPANIQSAVTGGATNLRLIRMGSSPQVDDSTFRIALPPQLEFGTLSIADALPENHFKITLPAGSYHVGAILPRLSARLPRIYAIKSLTSGSTNLLSEPLKVSGAEPVEIDAVFSTSSTVSWVKVSGHVVGLPVGTERDNRVVLSGEVVAPLVAPIQSDGSFEFPKVIQGRYIARVVPSADFITAAQRPRSRSDYEISVTDKDVTGLQIGTR